MLAPQTIQVRYGPTGLLAGSLGALLGRNEAFQRQSGMDQSFINNRLNYADQQQQQADAMNANALQQAHQQFAQPQQSQQPPVQNPADYAVNQAYLTGAAQDISPASQAALSALANKPGVKPSEFAGVLSSSVTNQQKRKQEEDANSALSQKREFLKSAAADLDPNDVNTLAAAVEDPKFTTTQLNMAVSGLRRAKQRQIQQQQIQDVTAQRQQQVAQSKSQAANIDEQMRLTAREMSDIKKGLLAQGLNPDVMTPSQFNPTMSQRPHNASDFIPDAMTAGLSGLGLNPQVPGIVTGQGNAASRPDYIKYKKLDMQMRNLAAQRAAAQRTAGGGMMEASPAGDSSAGELQNSGGKQLTTELAVQFYQAAGGDPNKARQMAIEQGYQP